jgi:hypothetical protein
MYIHEGQQDEDDTARLYQMITRRMYRAENEDLSEIGF